MKMTWHITPGKKSVLLKDAQGNARGAITRCKGFMLAFVKSLNGTVKITGSDASMQLLGAYPSVQSAGEAVQAEVLCLLRTGKYERIVEH